MLVKKDYVVTYFNGDVEHKIFTKRQLKNFVKNNVVRSIEEGTITTSFNANLEDIYNIDNVIASNLIASNLTTSNLGIITVSVNKNLEQNGIVTELNG